MTSGESWKEFDQNPVTHSAAHHLVAIAELIDEYGYARVSDVARRLEITRGSVSVTLKGLKQRGLVLEDDRRHLRLSEIGEGIAHGVIAKKQVMKELFIRVLGVGEEQADIDTCKIEHLISEEAARRATDLLRFVGSETSEVQEFFSAMKSFAPSCSGDPGECPVCDEVCLQGYLETVPGEEG